MGRAAARKAFTLIELIVVIVIIGILAAVAAVSYNSFIAGAENTSAESTYAQVVKMIQAQSALDQAVPASGGYTGAANDTHADWVASATAPAYKVDVPDTVTVLTITNDGDATNPTATVEATIDGKSCTGITISGVGQQTGDITCDTP